MSDYPCIKTGIDYIILQCGANNMKKNAFDEIEGVGAYRRKKLLEHFGSPKAVAQASLAELSLVEGISENIAKKIYTFFHK